MRGADIKFVTIIRNLVSITGQGIRGWGGEGRAFGNGVEVTELKTATVKRIGIQVIGRVNRWVDTLSNSTVFPWYGI